MKKVIAMLLIMILAASVLAGCSSSQTNVDPSETGDSDGKLKIGFSVISLTFPYYVSMLDGIEAACEEKGWELISTDAGMDVEKTINDCIDLITQGVDVLVIASWYGDSLSEVFEQCKNADIPVFMIDTGNLPEDGDYVTNIGTDNFDAGYVGGNWTAKYFIEQGKNDINMIAFTTATSIGRDRVDGFVSGLEAGGLNVNKLNEYLGESREGFMSHCEDALTTYEDIDLIFGTNTLAGLGAYDSCVAADRTEIKIVGFDCEDDEVALIDSGTQYIATIKQLPYEMAFQTIQNIDGYLNKDATFEKTTPFESGVYSIDGDLKAEDILN
ncbi:MAG TPA: sugar ABC transporter substrate-binding protein [Thermoanaerobacterales bacterium]|nr:sugar ABC transporter substrate-binding protein [Thermoanaerobacterales bacterium]